MNILRKKNGTALLMSLLLMTGIITVSLATGILIMNEIQQSTQLDRAMVAFYAAESAVERGLYQSRQQSFDPDVLSAIEVLMDNNASYKIIAEDSENVVIKSLAQDETLQLDLYNSGSLSALSPAVKALGFNWLEQQNAWLEVRWISWTTAGSLNPGAASNWQNKGRKISQGDVPYIMNLENADNYLYSVRLTARYASITNLEVKAYDTINPVTNCDPLTSCQIGIPGRVFIKGLGEYPNGKSDAAKQAILVTMPEVEPLSGFYDYVLFSEEAIMKEN